MDMKDWFNGLDEDLQAKVRACKTIDELTAVLKAAGQELSEDLLNGIAAGAGCDDEPFILCTVNCPVVIF
jgi:hypothetical protein